MFTALWSLDSHFHLWWKRAQFSVLFVLTFVESVNNTINRIAFISTAICKNKRRNSPLIPARHWRIVFCLLTVPFLYPRRGCMWQYLQHLGNITLKPTPWGKALLRKHPCLAASALNTFVSSDIYLNPPVHREKKSLLHFGQWRRGRMIKVLHKSRPLALQ